MNRRDVMVMGSALAASSVLSASEKGSSKRLQRSYQMKHKIKALSFDPASLKGISQKVIVSHHDNNYAGAVKKLNLIQKQISAMPVNAHPIELGALKKEELIALNSKLLHELYFDNLAADVKITARITEVLGTSFGSVEAWKNDFVKTAKSLSGGSGWVILSYIKEEGVLINQIAGDHTDSVATGIPLLVMDMYEHSYHMDYGVKASNYIEAFMSNINWKIVSDRWDKA